MHKNILIFAAGLGIGVGGSYLYFRKKFNDELEERMEKEMQALNELYDKVNDEYMASKHKEEYAPEETEDVQEGDAPKAKIFRKESAEERKNFRYDQVTNVDPAELEHPEDDAPEEDGENNLDNETRAGLEFAASRAADIKRAPERIAEQDVGEYADYEKQTWLYYPIDDAFFDEVSGEEIYNADEIIQDTIDYWRQSPENIDDVYVRSYRLATDYTIVKMDGSHASRTWR